MVSRKDNVIKTLDWWTVGLYLILVLLGWLSICGASYDYGLPDFFDLGTRAGKQLMWIGCSFCLVFVLLTLDARIYDTYAYLFYGIMILVLLAMVFNPTDIKGSHSWIVLGPVSLQPAEFAKFTTALALAKFMGEYTFSLKRTRHMITVVCMILLPCVLIVCQKETGSALVFLAFFLMLYREGMTGAVLFSGVCAVIYFIVGIRFGGDVLGDELTSAGDFYVLFLIVCFSILLVRLYCKEYGKAVSYMTLVCVGGMLLGLLFSLYVIPFDVVQLQYWICGGLLVWLLVLFLRSRIYRFLFIMVFLIVSAGFSFSLGYVFNKVLEPHQKIRIEVLLGMKDDPAGAGYNVNQSKIAIGSGGFLGKGFLNGTQTKLKYVPEQATDFIFCTVGEEQGFLGASFVIILFSAFIVRLVLLAERQTSAFGRVYGYSVASIFFFHLFVNVGMVLGLTPVIGIPLPFFSYGGSSLWGFTILLFVFLRIDAAREV